MLAVYDDLVLQKIDELKTEIDNVENVAKAEAEETGNNKGWNEETKADFVVFLLKKDKRFDVKAKQEKLDFLMTFCYEKPEPEETVYEG